MTPEANPRPPRRRPPFRRPLASLWFGAAILAVLVLFNLVTSSGRRETLDYSEFKSLLAQGRIAEVELGPERVRGEFQDGDGALKAFEAVRVEDPKLTELLEAQKVRYTGQVSNAWLTELVGWVFPVLLIVGIWVFFLRRMGGAEGGIMSFARSRAKVYVDDDVKVGFADVAGVDEAATELREIVGFLKNPAK
jgi:cell division protease FtsH